jgi:hypothetical protein
MKASRILPLSFASLVIIIAIVFGWVLGSSGKASQGPGNQPGRYSIAVAGDQALLVDTLTGCVWRAITLKMPQSHISFPGDLRLVSVEGLVDVPPMPKEQGDPPRRFPEVCRAYKDEK